MMRQVSFILLMVLLISCNSHRTQDDTAYHRDFSAWQAKRWQDLRSEEGWLNLAGLYWLEEGMNSFGSDTVNDVVFPAGFPLKRAGYFLINGTTVRMITRPEAQIKVNGQLATDALMFHPDSTKVIHARKNEFRWTIIRRENKLGVRLRNLDSTFISHFTEPARFPVDAGYRVKAKFVRYGQGHTILVSNVLGQATPQPSPGRLDFKFNGVQSSFDALEGGDELFIVFGDSTTGRETYGGGRFLYAPMPDADGNVELDFNKAINPPCVFTPFATCPLPPVQNVLPLAVRAGERDYHH